MIGAAIWLVSLIVLVALLVRVGESKVAFFPTRGETMTPGDLGVAFEALTIPTADGERLHAWKLAPAGAPRARVVYFHGNGGNLSMWAPILAGLARHGSIVFAIDYRGYGLSSGRPSERGLYRDVDAALDREWKDVERVTPLVFWGRSLGATMAAYAGTRVRPDGLILESGFPDARSLVRSSPLLALLAVFSSYRFPTARFVERVGVPLLVMHGDADQVVPFDLGRVLFAGARGPKRFFTIRGGDHNDAVPPDPSAYWRAVADFLAGLKPLR